MAWTKTKDWDAIQSGRKKIRYSDAQRAAYWKKKYLALLKSRSR